MTERTVWLHTRHNDGGTHVLIWHLESDTPPETLCGRTTRDMEAVPTPWDEVFSPCRDCHAFNARAVGGSSRHLHVAYARRHTIKENG